MVRGTRIYIPYILTGMYISSHSIYHMLHNKQLLTVIIIIIPTRRCIVIMLLLPFSFVSPLLWTLFRHVSLLPTVPALYIRTCILLPVSRTLISMSPPASRVLLSSSTSITLVMLRILILASTTTCASTSASASIRIEGLLVRTVLILRRRRGKTEILLLTNKHRGQFCKTRDIIPSIHRRLEV